MRLLILWLGITLCFSSPANAKWHNFSSKKSNSPRWEVIESGQNKVRLRVKIPGVDQRSVKINGKKYTQLDLPKASWLEEKGLPRLPKLSHDLAIPWDAKQVSVEVNPIKTRTLRFEPPIPSRGTIFRNEDPDKKPYRFSAFYNSQQQYPKQVAVVSSPFVLRDIKGVNLQFHPVQYNSADKIYTVTEEVEITLNWKGNSATLVAQGTSTSDVTFLNFYRNHFINLSSKKSSSAKVLERLIPEIGRLLIITNSRFKNTLQPFVQWKVEKGLQVKVATLEETGNTADKMKAYIQREYDQNKFSYLVLVGDAEFMPFHPGSNGNAVGQEADPMYGLVAGQDSYPDLFVSRFPAKNAEELKNMMWRSINYEKNPTSNGEWYSRLIGIGSSEGSWSGKIDYERIEELNKKLLTWHYVDVTRVYEPNDKASDISQALNSGSGFINYIGHGSESQWVTGGFSSSDIKNLNPSVQLPFIVSVACVNGRFNWSGGDSFAETWIKAGDTERPKGAVAIFASSTNQAWVPPTIGQRRITDLLSDEQMNTVGALFTHGSVAVLEDNDPEAIQTFETWHIFGDASLQVRSKTATTINSEQPNISENGEWVVAVNEKGIQGGLSFGSQWLGSGISDENGLLKIQANKSLPKGSQVKLTLTGFNKIPKTELINWP